MQQNLSIKLALAAIDKMSQPLNAARKASQGLSSAVKSTQDQIKALERQSKKLDKATDHVNKTTDALKKAQEQQKALRQEFGKPDQRTDEQKSAIKEASAQVAKYIKDLKAEKNNLQKVKEGFATLGISTAAGLTGRITRQTKEYNEQLSKQEAQLKRVTAAQAAYDKAKKIQGRMASVGVKAAATGGAMLWGGMRAMRPGMDFDRAYSETLADAHLGRDSEQGKALREQAKMLARTTHFSAVQAAQGQDQLISGGMTAPNAQKALPGMMNLALAAHSDLGAAASAGSNVLDHFQLQADQMGRVGDVLVGTFTHSKTSLESLNETLEYVGTVANNSGMSLETTAAAAAMLAKNGLQGSIAGTGLKETLNGIHAPSSKGAKALKDLQIATVSASGKVRPFADVMKELWDRTRKFDQGSQQDIFKSLFGAEGMTAAQVLARSAAEGNLQDFNDYLLKVQGTSAQTAKTMTDNFDGDMQMLHSAWDGLWTQVEEGADGALRNIAQWLTQTIQGVTAWAQEHPELTRAIIDTTLAVGALLLIVGAVLTTMAGLLGPLAAVRLSFALLSGGEGVGMLAGAFSALSEIASVVFAPIVAAIAAIGWPVLALVAVFAVAAAAIIRYWEPIKAFFSGYFSGLMEKMAPVIDSLKTWWRDISALFSWLWEKVTNFLSPVNETKSALDKCGAAGQTFGKLVGAGINLALTPLKLLIDGLDWVLKKAGIVPDVVQYSQESADALRKHLPPPKKPMVAVWDPATKKMTLKPWDWSADSDKPLLNSPDNSGSDSPKSPKGSSSTGNSGSEYGTAHWSGGKDKTGGGASSADTRINRLGDIVFKTLPSWVPLSGGFAQPQIVAGSGISGSRLTPPGVKAAPAIGTNVAGDINLHIHIEGADHLNTQQLATEVKHQVMGELDKLNRQKLASLKDRE